ncbi:MAG TPA: MBL fold metallo-hydrolase [Terracidiphilus sp.]|jgi:competence protein ComEC|nr:MBL fold metallo-hydrolase [Terracidiphilus sp.]
MKISAHFRSLPSSFRRCASGLLPLAALLSVAGPAAAAPAAHPANRSLLIYSIDVEGGQATLLVSEPSQASLLIDTGWAGNNGRDAERIQAAMKDAGITRIDRLLITHYHADHVGGVPNLVERVPVGEFLDHGPNREDTSVVDADYAAYLKAIAGKPHRTVHPGDTISIPGLSVVVISADGQLIKRVPGITPAPNPYCATEKHWDADPTENARSSGILVRLGRFSFLDLGDLTGAKEVALVCPNNPLGTIDLYLVTHHGMDWSNSRAIVDAIEPRVAIMNNGAHKAGMPVAWQIIHDSPRHPDLYQLHTAEGSDAAHNSPAALIANPRGAAADGSYFKVVAHPDGSFSVTNTRTGQTRQYGPEQ